MTLSLSTGVGRRAAFSAEQLRPWAGALAAAWLVIFAADAWIHTRNGPCDAAGEQLGRDFVNAWAAPRLAFGGLPAGVYDADTLNAFERRLSCPNALSRFYSYPPVNLILTAPISIPGFVPAFMIWTFGGMAALIAVLSRRLSWGGAIVAVLATPAVIFNAIYGQNGVLTALTLGGGLLLMERRPLSAGAAWGLLCFKPHLGLLLPFALAASGRWRTMVAAGAVVAALVGMSVALFGTAPWVAFVHDGPAQRAMLEATPYLVSRNPTVYNVARLAGGGPAACYAFQGLFALLSIGAVVQVWRGPATFRLKGTVLLLATFLTTPYAFDYDTIVLMLVCLWLAQSAAETGWRPWERLCLAVLWLSPASIAELATERFNLLIEPVFMALLLLLTVRRARLEGEAAHV